MVTEQNQQLKIALDDYLVQCLAGLPSESELSASQFFSPAFEKRMRKLIQNSQKGNSTECPSNLFDQNRHYKRLSSKTTKRLLLVAILLSISISVMSISAARESVFSFFVRIYDSFSTIIFNQETNNQAPITETSTATDDNSRNSLPVQIPNGYEKIDQVILDGFMQIFYANPTGDELIFERQLSDTLQVKLDTEGIQFENLKINQFYGLYYSNKGVQNLIWQEGPFVFMISGKVSKDEILNMAKSLK